MGFSMRLVFAGVQAAGEYAGLQMGLSFASFFDPTSGGNTMVIARLLNVMAMLIFLAVDGHLMLVMVLAESFQALPISDAPLAAGGWFLLANAGGDIFASGLMLALPLIATLLTLNLAMGILNRVSPQFSIFAVGFPITLLAGIAMLQLLMQYLAPFLRAALCGGVCGHDGVFAGVAAVAGSAGTDRVLSSLVSINPTNNDRARTIRAGHPSHARIPFSVATKSPAHHAAGSHRHSQSTSHTRDRHGPCPTGKAAGVFRGTGEP